MIHHQTHGPSPASAVLCLNDLDTTTREPRVYDLTLARVLGYEHSRNVRRLIKGARAELETHGELVEIRDRSGGTGNLLSAGANTLTPRAGRPGTAFYLNEGQALVVCALTRTAVAARVRGELIRVFMLHRVGEMRTIPKSVINELTPTERKALQHIVQHADVVLAPPAYGLPHAEGIYHYGGVDVIGQDGEGRIPYLLAPITHRILETLAEFEVDAAENEDTGDFEPSIGGYGPDLDAEGDTADTEPSLGSLDRAENQTRWAEGLDDELDDCDKEDGGDTEPNGDEDDDDELDTDNTDDTPIFGRVFHSIDAERLATAAASQRLLGIVDRLRGREARL